MKDSFIFEGKKYISARRASEISDYASDYVGQLCRAGKLDCRMIGRSWFVTEESIHLHKAAISREEASRSRIENLRGKPSKTPEPTVVPAIRSLVVVESNKNEQVSIVTKSEVKAEIKNDLNKVASVPWTVETPIKSPFVYTNDNRPLLPVLKKKVSDAIQTPIVVAPNKNIESVSYLKVVENNLVANDAVTKIKVSSIAPVAKKEVAPVVEKVEKDTEVVNSKTAKTTKNPNIVKTYSLKSLVTYSELTREIILKRVIAPTFAFVLLFGLGTGTYIAAEKIGNSHTFAQVAVSTKVAGANVSDAFVSAYDGIKSGYKSVVAFFTSPSKLAMNVPKEFGDVTVDHVTPNGIVLTSSTGSEVADDAMKDKIRGSFSDDVTISPDNSGTAGVITPVFKDTKGKDFIYVMVPVKDKTENETK
jgi:hypothetical protein